MARIPIHNGGVLRMKKLVKYLCLMTLVAGTAACNVEAVVDDLEAQAKAQAEAKLKDAFSSAVTEVALKAVQQGQGDQGQGAAPRFSKAVSDMSMNETFDINDTFTEDGATFTMTGKITMNMEGMNSTMTMDMKATWTNMKVGLDDGSEVLTNGEQTIKGDFTTEMTDPNDPSTMVIKMTMTTAGKISNVEGTADSTFDITMAFDSTTGKMKMTGTIDGQPYSEEFDMPLPGDLQGDGTGGPGGGELVGNCADQTGDVCYEYTGSAYASYTQANCPIDAPTFTAAMPCMGMTYVGACTYGAGTADEYTKYSSTDDSVACGGAGGTWMALQ